MAGPIRFAIDLFDRVSGPANKASDSLDKLGGTIDKTAAASSAMDKATLKSKVSIANKALEVPRLQKRLEKLNEELANGSKATHRFTEGWATKLTAVTTAGTAAFNVLSGLGSAAFSAGEKLLEAGAKQDRTNRIFKNLLGESGPAVQKYLRSVTGSTEMTTNQLEELVIPLARQFGPDQIKRLLPAALDVQARGGDANQAAAIFAKIASTGKIEGEGFGALGLKAPDALKVIGKIAGITDTKAIKQAIEQGKIGADAIMEGVLVSIARGGKLGDAAVEAATSPSAALNRFRNLSETIFSRLADSPALPKLTAALDKVVAALTSDKAIAVFSKFVEDIANAVAEVDWAAAAKGAVEVIDKILSFAGSAKGIVNVATFGSLGDKRNDAIKAEGGLRGALAYVPFVRLLLDDPKAPAPPSANDFLSRSDGSILKINSQDDVLGFKPGGPVEAAFANGPATRSQATGGSVVALTFGDINVGAGQSLGDVKAAIREVVGEVWSDYAIEGGY